MHRNKGNGNLKTWIYLETKQQICTQHLCHEGCLQIPQNNFEVNKNENTIY